MIRWLAIAALCCLPSLVWGAWADDRDASAGYVTATVAATSVDEAVSFVRVALSDLPSGFHDAMDAASDTTGRTIRAASADGATGYASFCLSYDAGTDSGAFFFLATGMSASVDVDYRIYVGNAALTMQSSAGVFADYEAVYFPGEDVINFANPGTGDLTAVNSPGTTASGIEGITAATYDTTDYYQATNPVTDWPLSLELIFYAENTSTFTPFSISDAGSNFSQATIVTTAGDFRGAFEGASGSTSQAQATASYTAQTWHTASITRNTDGGETWAYIDGGNGDFDGTSISSPTFDTLTVGARIQASTLGFNGRIAVATASATVRSADHVSTMNTNWTTGLYTAGAWTPSASGPTGHPWYYLRYRR